jgi:hypothetical protein
VTIILYPMMCSYEKATPQKTPEKIVWKYRRKPKLNYIRCSLEGNDIIITSTLIKTVYVLCVFHALVDKSKILMI